MQGQPGFAVRVDRRCMDHVEVRLVGELDIAGERTLRRRLEAAVALSDDVRVDLSRLSFIDVSGVRALADVAAMAREHDGHLELRDATPTVARLFELTRAGGLLSVPACA
jgi:anti-sigma B factor antagonist